MKVSASLLDGGNKTLNTKNIIIATGSEVSPLPPCPVDNDAGKIVDSTGALVLKTVPAKMIVVGGGVIGLEMGSVYSRLGSEVTVIEYLDHIVPGTDSEIGQNFMRILKKQGLKFKLGHKVTGTKTTADGVTLTMEPSKGGDPVTLDANVVLVATGRRPYTKGLGLEEMGIQMDKLGRIEVDDHFRTQIPNIYAIGDCIKGPMLAHKSEEEGIAAVELIAGKGPAHVNYDAIPGVIYTNPELATVGKTEEQLKKDGIKYRKGSFSFMANSRGRTTNDTDGLVKVLTDAETDRILGVHIIGSNAGEMIMEG